MSAQNSGVIRGLKKRAERLRRRVAALSWSRLRNAGLGRRCFRTGSRTKEGAGLANERDEPLGWRKQKQGRVHRLNLRIKALKQQLQGGRFAH